MPGVGVGGSLQRWVRPTSAGGGPYRDGLDHACRGGGSLQRWVRVDRRLPGGGSLQRWVRPTSAGGGGPYRGGLDRRLPGGGGGLTQVG